MADSAHSTATPDVHPLTGCSAPGAASPDFIPVAEMPSPFVSLGDAAADVVAKLAVRRAVDSLAAQHGPDAEVIELAERTEALALRECALWGRLADLDDAVTRAMPPRPVRPTMQTRMQHAEATVDGARTISVTEPPAWRVEHQAVEAAYAAAVAEHERLEAETGARLGLPLANKLTTRASRRLSRWGRRLAGLSPRTYAGLRAKAAALRATVEDGQLYDQWRQVLAVSVGADAIRLIEAEAEERFLEDRARDGELFSLLGRWDGARTALDTSWHRFEATWELAVAAYPPRPDALGWSADDFPRTSYGRGASDPVGDTGAREYGARGVEWLRRLRSTVQWGEAAEARRREIIGAHEAWMEARRAAEDATGHTATVETVQADVEALNAAEEAAKLCEPRTPAGLARKAAWVADLLARDAGDDDLAEVFVRQVAEFSAGVANPRSAASCAPPDPFATFHSHILALHHAIERGRGTDADKDRLMDRWGQIDAQALVGQPTTLAGALGALQMSRCEYVQFQLLECENTDDPSKKLVLHLVDGAIAVLSRLGLGPDELPRDERVVETRAA